MAESEKHNPEELVKDLTVKEPEEEDENIWKEFMPLTDEGVWKVTSELDEEDAEFSFVGREDWNDDEEDDDDDREEIDYYDEEVNESLKNTPFGDLSTNIEKK